MIQTFLNSNDQVMEFENPDLYFTLEKVNNVLRVTDIEIKHVRHAVNFLNNLHRMSDLAFTIIADCDLSTLVLTLLKKSGWKTDTSYVCKVG